jgi:hypothetical protein
MPRNQCALFVDEHRDGPAPFADRGSDLGYLLLGMSASIAGIGDEFCERPALNLVRRPLGLARMHYARARARPRAPAKVGKLVGPVVVGSPLKRLRDMISRFGAEYPQFGSGDQVPT